MLLVALAVSFAGVGCRSNELASTNIDNGGHITPSLSGSFTITDQTISGIRDKAKEMFKPVTFADGKQGLAELEFAADGTVALDVSGTPPWGAFSPLSPVTVPQVVSLPKSLVLLGGGLNIPLVTSDDKDAATRDTIKQLYKLTGLNDGFTAVVTMDPDDIVSAFMPRPGEDPLPGLWFPLVLQLPTIQTQRFDCDCGSESGSFLDCKSVCDGIKQAFNIEICSDITGGCSQPFAGGSCSAAVFVHSFSRIPITIGLVPEAQLPATTFDWTPGFQLGGSGTTFVAGKDFHFGDMIEVAAVPGGTIHDNGGAEGSVECGDYDLCVGGALYDCNSAGADGCSASEIFPGTTNCHSALGQTVADEIAKQVASGFSSALAPQLQKLFAYDGSYFTPSSPPHLLSTPCSLLSLDKPGGCSSSYVEDTLLPASVTYQKWDWFLGPFNQLGPAKGHVRLTAVYPTPSTVKNLPSLHRNVRLADIRIDYDGDPDGDGVTADVDNCPGTGDPDQTDSDQDGAGDGCDPCPCSASETALNGDGLCDTCDATLGAYCQGHCADNPPDNCVGVSNPGQENCNEEAERAKGLPLKGDACDHTPCADSSADIEPLQADFAPSCPPNPSGLPSNCNIGVNTHLRWHGVADDPNATHQGKAVFGHCPCTGPHATIAERLFNCQFDQTGANNCIDAQAGAFPIDATVPSLWRPMTTTYKTGGTPSTGPVHLATATNHLYPTDYRRTGSAVQDQSWRFDLDLARYGLTPPASVTQPQQLFPLDAALAGVTWAFTPEYEGVKLTGTTADLASDYFDQGLSPDGAVIASILGVNSCMVGGCGQPTPTLTLPPWLAITSSGDIAYATEHWTRPAPEGMFDADTAHIFAGVGTLYTLVTPAEPARRLDVQRTILRGALLDQATGMFLSPVYSFGDQVFVGSRDVIGGHGDPPLPETRRVATASSAGASTMSGLHQEVYTVRMSPDGLSELLDRWTVSDGEIDTRAITGLDRVGQPLAATYDYDRDVVFALDQVVDGRGARLRLLGVGRDGLGRVLANAPLTGVHDRFFLSMDVSGHPVISASPRQPSQRALVAVVAPDDDAGTAGIGGWGFAPHAGRLLAAPVSGLPGTWSFLRQDASGATRIDELQPAELHVARHPASLGEVL